MVIVLIVVISMVLILGLFIWAFTDKGTNAVNRSNSETGMKRNRLQLNPKYANSIKCKYCEHFNSDGCFCHIYPRGTSPDDACERFSLPLFQSMGCAFEAAEGREFTYRPDGSQIVDLDNASK